MIGVQACGEFHMAGDVSGRKFCQILVIHARQEVTDDLLIHVGAERLNEGKQGFRSHDSASIQKTAAVVWRRYIVPCRPPRYNPAHATGPTTDSDISIATGPAVDQCRGKA